jgi:hypothetical protein
MEGTHDKYGEIQMDYVGEDYGGPVDFMAVTYCHAKPIVLYNFTVDSEQCNAAIFRFQRQMPSKQLRYSSTLRTSAISLSVTSRNLYRTTYP